MSVDNVNIWHRMTNINLADSSVTDKSPNLNHHQYFRIYGVYIRNYIQQGISSMYRNTVYVYTLHSVILLICTVPVSWMMDE